MGRYSKISRRIWNDDKFRALSPLQPSGQALWLYLLTCTDNQNIPGLFEAREVALADKLGWSMKAFREAFTEVKAQGMIEADWKAGLLWLPKSINHNRPVSVNVVKSWSDTWDDLPECALKTKAYQALLAYTEGLGEAFAEAFRLACRKPNGKVSIIQEQEQEQKQETIVDNPVDEPRFQDNVRISHKVKGKLTDSEIEVCKFYITVHRRKHTYLIGPKRLKALRGAMKDRDIVEIKKAIIGCRNSSFHFERTNERGEKYNDLELIFRDETKTDDFIRRYKRGDEKEYGENFDSAFTDASR